MKYPKDKQSLITWLELNSNYTNLYNSLNPTVFDVTLRDGLQGLNLNNISFYTTPAKKELYQKIKHTYNPDFIEIGSIVSKNIFPIFQDSIDLFNSCIQTEQINNNFLLVPNSNQLEKIINLPNCICQNISLITSVSDTFQKTNTKKSLEETKLDLIKIVSKIRSDKYILNPTIKLYISCIDTCPYSGKIPVSYIINELKWYWENLQPDILCLSDTCGELTNDTFIEIISGLKKNNIPLEKISLHLHAEDKEYEQVQKIFFTAFDEKITHFDLSLLDSGGCIVTLGHDKIKPNITYKLYYKLLVDWILSKL
jgi:isopropylmalate/homocitrate/citramalate synthase